MQPTVKSRLGETSGETPATAELPGRFPVFEVAPDAPPITALQVQQAIDGDDMDALEMS